MSVPVPISRKDYKSVMEALTEETEVICLDARAYVTTMLVALDLLYQGQEIAKVVKGY